MRKFYEHFHRIWPYWFYFCDLNSETLSMIILCLLPNLSGFERVGQPQAAVEYNPVDSVGFIQKTSRRSTR